MKIQKWLTVSEAGKTRVTAGKPGLDWDEVSILLNIELPDALFDKPKLQADITIPEEAARPTEITATVIENVADAIRTSTGLEFHISVIKDEEDDTKT